eukprot:9111347-Pyramimonas_sp.AAC.1
MECQHPADQTFSRSNKGGEWWKCAVWGLSIGASSSTLDQHKGASPGQEGGLAREADPEGKAGASPRGGVRSASSPPPQHQGRDVRGRAVHEGSCSQTHEGPWHPRGGAVQRDDPHGCRRPAAASPHTAPSGRARREALPGDEGDAGHAAGSPQVQSGAHRADGQPDDA